MSLRPYVSLGLIFLLACAGSGTAIRSTGSAGDDLAAALQEALDDERHAQQFYAAVMEKHGEVLPFAHIIEAEKRHEAALLQTMERYGIEPAETQPGRREVPVTLAEACAMSAEWEKENAALHARLLAVAAGHPDIERVFTNLRDASRERHLVAFQRCAEGLSCGGACMAGGKGGGGGMGCMGEKAKGGCGQGQGCGMRAGAAMGGAGCGAGCGKQMRGAGQGGGRGFGWGGAGCGRGTGQ